MDPVTAIGLAGSIIGVIQLTGTILTLTHGYIGAVRSAPKDREELQRSLQEFRQFLEDLDDRIKKNPQLISLTKLNSEDGPLKRWSEELESLRSKLDKQEKLTSLMWPLKATEVTQFVGKLEEYKNSLNLALGLDHLSVTQDMNLTVQSEAAENTAWRRNEIARRKKKEAFRAEGERSTSLGWLYPEPTGTKHFEISEKRQQGTGDWFLRSPEFSEFIKEKPNASLLWAHGVPGAGKTYITSLVIDHLKGRDKWGVAYIYFDYKDQQQHKPKLVIASLVKQLASQTSPTPPRIEELHNSLKKEEREATFEELYMVLLVVRASFSRAFIVFDALDECEPGDQRKLLLLFERMGKDGFDVFLTSRPYPGDIQLSLARAPKIEVLANEEDIRLYIREKLGEHPQARLLFHKAQCDDITSDLMAITQGMFLLVRFYIEDLVQQTSANQIQTTLKELKQSTTRQGPGPLDFIYERAMKTIRSQPENRKNLAIKVLSWLIKAKRTLAFDEIQLAVSVKHQKYTVDDLDLPDRMMLLDVCAGLVTVDENTKTVRLVHYTAQEFLLKDSELLDTANFNVAMACVTYLSFDVFAQGACTSEKGYLCRLELHPFFMYAAEYVSFHLGACDERLSTDIVLKFLECSGSLNSFQQQVREDRRDYHFDFYRRNITPLHIASRIGHCAASKLLIEKGTDPWAVDDGGRTALHYAAIQGHIGVVRVLMQGVANGKATGRGRKAVVRLLAKSSAHSSNILWRATRRGCEAVVGVLESYIWVKDCDGETALHSAAESGYEPIVRMLIEEGADVSAKNVLQQTALHSVARGGNVEVAQLLIVEGADISVRDNNGKTALHFAARGGSAEVVQLLIAEGTDISVQDKDGETALHFAAWGGSAEVVRHLIAGGAGVSVQDKDGKTALHEAARGGSAEVVQLLIVGGADISAQGKGGETALHFATRRGSAEVAQLLIAECADISVQDKDGETALHFAAWGGSAEVVRQLIAKGTDISVQNKDGKTALHEAAWGRSAEVVRLLIAEGADILVRAKDGNTALHFAAWGGSAEVVRLLIAEGADISVRNKSRRTVLHFAAWGESAEVAQLLVVGGADISVQDKDGKTALHEAARRGSAEVVEHLITGGADISAREKNGETALHFAAWEGNAEVVRLLIMWGADISAREKGGNMALHFAARKESAEVVWGLIAEGGGVLARDHDGKTALHFAAREGSAEVVQLLIVGGADISVKDKDGKTALHFAAWRGCAEVVQILIVGGADISAQEKNGETALHFAAWRGSVEAVKLLIAEGADTSVLSGKGETAMDKAKSHLDAEVASVIEVALRGPTNET